jgi:hypothetical protein
VKNYQLVTPSKSLPPVWASGDKAYTCLVHYVSSAWDTLPGTLSTLVGRMSGEGGWLNILSFIYTLMGAPSLAPVGAMRKPGRARHCV